jgi:hypothetical protein
MRVVYEIQSRLSQDNERPLTRERATPPSSPNGQPGRTEKTNPSSPKQQNRADEIGRNLQVLAAECPMLTGFYGERRVP